MMTYRERITARALAIFMVYDKTLTARQALEKATSEIEEEESQIKEVA